MADGEQVQRLLQSVKGWNAWRETYEGKVDLSWADLRGADLER